MTPRITPIATRLSGFGNTVFAEMTSLALRSGAINLGQGYPDTDGPSRVIDAAQSALRNGENQYPPATGIAPLREAISQQREDRYATSYDPDNEVLVTTGATEAITASILALCEPGDEVVLFEPYYDSYAAAIAMAGAVRRTVPLRPTNGRFVFDPAELARAVTSNTRLLLFNTPHNPTGKVFDTTELRLIADLCLDRGLVAVVDEVYEYLTYDASRHIPLASYPGLRDRTLCVSSAGKTFSLTGWKIGWLCGPAALVNAVRIAKQYLTFASGAPYKTNRTGSSSSALACRRGGMICAQAYKTPAWKPTPAKEHTSSRPTYRPRATPTERNSVDSSRI